MSAYEKILIVDDNKGDRFLLATALTDNGVAVVDSVSSGEEAVRYVSKLKDDAHPELIFVDLIMERMSGLDLLRWLRQNSVFDHIPVVILTSSRNEEQKATAIALKAKAFYLKPMKLEELDVIVKKALEHCRHPESV
jgi:CheY-like chemotaxis protein